MTKYTTSSLIAELEKFPEDTPIRTELAFIYNYDPICDFLKGDMSDKAFLEYTKSRARDVAIFEGSWKDDNISDLNNIMPEYVEGWYKTKEDTKPYKIYIKNININTEDDPEKIKSALMNLIIEMQEQVSPRQVSRTVGEPPSVSTDASTDTNNQDQAEGQDEQNANGNTNTNNNPTT